MKKGGEPSSQDMVINVVIWVREEIEKKSP
jgi:hypothetical protein